MKYGSKREKGKPKKTLKLASFFLPRTVMKNRPNNNVKGAQIELKINEENAPQMYFLFELILKTFDSIAC